jgi:hypothetical protein
MSIELEEFVRKPFVVKAIMVTPMNMVELAEFCEGKIMHDGEKEGHFSRDYIKVEVRNPRDAEQTKARIGDYLVKQGNTWKVYKPKQMRGTFEKRDGSQVPIQQAANGKRDGKAQFKKTQGQPSPAMMPRKKPVSNPGLDLTRRESVEQKSIEQTSPEAAAARRSDVPEVLEGNAAEVAQTEGVLVGGDPTKVGDLLAESDSALRQPEVTDVSIPHNHSVAEGCDENNCPGDRYADGKHEFADQTVVTELGGPIKMTRAEYKAMLQDAQAGAVFPEVEIIPEVVKPITLDELNAMPGDPRTAEEIMAENKVQKP